MTVDVHELVRQRRYERALEQLLDRYEARVYRMAVTMLGDRGRAEEVTQDIFLKLWRALPSYDGRAALSTWLYTITRNTCLSALRSESYRKAAPLEPHHEPRVTGIGPLDLAVAQGLERLAPIQRQVLTLFYFEDRSVTEVAALLDLPEGTVKSHLHRARLALGAMME